MNRLRLLAPPRARDLCMLYRPRPLLRYLYRFRKSRELNHVLRRAHLSVVDLEPERIRAVILGVDLVLVVALKGVVPVPVRLPLGLVARVGNGLVTQIRLLLRRRPLGLEQQMVALSVCLFDVLIFL